jgi:hypothetical protein
VDVVSVHYGPHEKSVLHDHPGGVVVSLTDLICSSTSVPTFNSTGMIAATPDLLMS